MLVNVVTKDGFVSINNTIECRKLSNSWSHVEEEEDEISFVSRNSEWGSRFSPIFLLISRVLERERDRERGWTDADVGGALTRTNLPPGYAPMVAAFRVVISSCSLAMRDKCVVRWKRSVGEGEKVARGSGLAIVYTSSSFRAERDPRVTFVSGVPDAARCRFHRRRALVFAFVFRVWRSD